MYLLRHFDGRGRLSGPRRSARRGARIRMLDRAGDDAVSTGERRAVLECCAWRPARRRAQEVERQRRRRVGCVGADVVRAIPVGRA